MGLCVIEYLLRRAVFHKGLKHEPVAALPVMDSCIKLAVRKGSCPSLSELDIGVRTEVTCPEEFLYIGLSLLTRFSSFYYNRIAALFSEDKSREKTGRT